MYCYKGLLGISQLTSIVDNMTLDVPLRMYVTNYSFMGAFVTAQYYRFVFVNPVGVL